MDINIKEIRKKSPVADSLFISWGYANGSVLLDTTSCEHCQTGQEIWLKNKSEIRKVRAVLGRLLKKKEINK